MVGKHITRGVQYCQSETCGGHSRVIASSFEMIIQNKHRYCPPTALIACPREQDPRPRVILPASGSGASGSLFGLALGDASTRSGHAEVAIAARRFGCSANLVLGVEPETPIVCLSRKSSRTSKSPKSISDSEDDGSTAFAAVECGAA